MGDGTCLRSTMAFTMLPSSLAMMMLMMFRVTKKAVCSDRAPASLLHTPGTHILKRFFRYTKKFLSIVFFLAPELTSGAPAGMVRRRRRSCGRRLLSKQTRIVPPTMKCARRSLGMLVTANCALLNAYFSRHWRHKAGWRGHA